MIGCLSYMILVKMVGNSNLIDWACLHENYLVRTTLSLYTIIFSCVACTHSNWNSRTCLVFFQSHNGICVHGNWGFCQFCSPSYFPILFLTIFLKHFYLTFKPLITLSCLHSIMSIGLIAWWVGLIRWTKIKCEGGFSIDEIMEVS